eukprot:TRINITY_DN2478_c0_g1_i3.p1 TRINITY_DN2478_c0_g1~~TRINITY_DN2478_c0_g1_i3.p1  ORF type:complete len:234 (+),score=72.79 TRINITY_DN2478_c0_g1_i3:69-704(+)
MAAAATTCLAPEPWVSRQAACLRGERHSAAGALAYAKVPAACVGRLEWVLEDPLPTDADDDQEWLSARAGLLFPADRTYAREVQVEKWLVALDALAYREGPAAPRCPAAPAPRCPAAPPAVRVPVPPQPQPQPQPQAPAPPQVPAGDDGKWDGAALAADWKRAAADASCLVQGLNGRYYTVRQLRSYLVGVMGYSVARFHRYVENAPRRAA